MRFSSLMDSLLVSQGGDLGDFLQLFGAFEAVLFGAVFVGAFRECPDRHKSLQRPSESDPLDTLGGNIFKGTPFLETSGRSQSGQHEATGVKLLAITPETRSKLIK